PRTGSWTGRLFVLPGEESRTYLEIANSSTGDVLLTGQFEPVGRVDRGPKDPGVTSGGTRDVLAAARAVLQARSGAGGGNPNSIDLPGKVSIYVDHVEARPLDFSQPPTSRDESHVYFEGGHVPGGMAFVVTEASWSGSSAGDSNGHGELKLVVAGKVLV